MPPSLAALRVRKHTNERRGARARVRSSARLATAYHQEVTPKSARLSDERPGEQEVEDERVATYASQTQPK